MARKVLAAGYPFVDGSVLKTFDDYPGRISFLAPEVWPFKGGKYITRPPKRDNIHTTKAFFTHSNYPFIGGILKGWMPVFPVEVFEQRPDVVFSVSEPNLLTTTYQALFSKLFGAKHVIFTWENIPFEKKFRGFKGAIQKFIIKINFLLSDGFICGNSKGKEIILSLGNKPVQVMPTSGVDTEFFKRDLSDKSFKGTDHKEHIVFSFAGAFGYRKGIHLIIEAFKELSKTMPNVRLLLAGTGEYESQIDELIALSGAQSLITKVPWLDRNGLRELFNASDVFLYPSIPNEGWEEQFGYSLMEASSMELPIITTRSGSISELVVDGKTGILIKPDNMTALKEAMMILAKDEEKRILMGRNGREFVAANYGEKVISKKYYNFFENLK